MAAKKPESTAGPPSERVIMLLAGESGSGKSFFIANLKNALIFDTDIGGGLAYADARIRRNGSQRIEVSSYLDILDEITKRNTALDGITTLAIDHLSSLQQEANLRHNPKMESDYGKANEKATKEWRKIRELVRNRDFNLICTAHQKAKYEANQIVGQTTDASKNIEADMSIVIYLHKPANNQPPSLARVQKWRRDPEDDRGLVPGTFLFTMDEFLKIHGLTMDGKRHEVSMAKPEQIAELTRLLEIVKLPEGVTDKWLSKAKAESWAELTEETIVKCLAHVQDLLAKPKTAERGAAV